MESGGAVSRSSTWITREALNVDEALATPRQSVGDPVSRSEVRAEPMIKVRMDRKPGPCEKWHVGGPHIGVK